MQFYLRLKACLLVIASATRFLEFQKAAAPAIGASIASEDSSAHVVHNAFWLSLLLVLVSCIVGAVAGATAGDIFGPATARLISALQMVGALLLLWGTLFVRGWQIQTYKGISLIERVNQWIYRALYCLGTAVFVASLAWPQR
jgi:ABC-type dipeptide/oligopeptide/nickel transport system permease component